MADSGAKLIHAATRFSRAYLIALVLVGILVGASHTILRQMVSSQINSAHQVDVAGAQRMLSQRIALLMTQLAVTPNDQSVLSDLSGAREAFAAQHERLVRGDDRFGGAVTEGMRQIYFDAPHDVDARSQALMRAAADMIDNPRRTTAFSEAIEQAKGPLLLGLNAAVAHLETEMRGHLHWVMQAATGLAVLTLLVLVGQALIVFRPLTRQIQESAHELIGAHDSLQNSVRRDALTGLPNRHYLHEHLALTLHNAARQSLAVGICHFDLAGFRRLNERLGHDAGDRVLIHVANVIKTETRRGDFIARLGADEFIVVTPHVTNEDGLKWLSKRVSSRIAEPLTLDGGVCRLTTSAGIAIAQPGATVVRQLLSDADLALREAKRSGQPTLCTPNLRDAHENRLALRDDLDRALDSDEIEPWFQPQISAKTGEISGLEALARWRHPEKGLLSPAIFIDAATEFGFGDRLAERILDRSLSSLASWRESGLVIPCIGVNFAAEHLNDPFMVEKIKWAVEARSLEPKDLCIEILESVLVEDGHDDTAKNVTALSRAGFHVDLDDFGTGRASIATLQRFPIDRIKVDRSFVTNIDSSAEQQKVTRAMIDLAHTLGVQALAEGVETKAEWAKLTELGCDHLQGFCIGRPMPAAEIQQWAAEWPTSLDKTG